MNVKTKSLLESLVDLTPSKDNSLIIESRGTHVISSAISLLETISECYGQELAEELEKRMLSSIRHRNNGKFIRGIKNLQASK
jgi:hypothetical protein